MIIFIWNFVYDKTQYLGFDQWYHRIFLEQNLFCQRKKCMHFFLDNENEDFLESSSYPSIHHIHNLCLSFKMTINEL